MQVRDDVRHDDTRHRFGLRLQAARTFIAWLCGRPSQRGSPSLGASADVILVSPTPNPPLRRRWRALLQTRAATAGELDAVLEVLAAAIELREEETGEHTRRVTRLALALARKVAPELAAEPEFRYGCLLHDIGKLGVPDSVLAKSHALTPAEIRQLEQHPVIGAQLVTASVLLSGAARDVIAFHHERWDGTGYPWGLGGAQIPLAARIFTIADRFDALTSERPYRKGIPLQRALAELKLEAGRCLDPSLVDEFIPVAAKLGLPSRQTRRRHLRVA